MRTGLTSAFIAKMQAVDTEPLLAAKFHFASGVVVASDTIWELELGVFTEAIVEDWGNISDSQDIDAAVRGDGLPTRKATITVINKSPNYFSAKFNDEPPENIKVELYQSFHGLGFVDVALIDSFVIQDPISWAENNILLSMDLLSYNQYSNPFIGTLNPDTNEYYGVAIGSLGCVSGSLFGVNPIARLSHGIAAGTTDIGCDTDLLSVGFTAPGQITIDFETIGYAGITDNVFTGCVVADTHDAEQYVLKYLHDYVFAFVAGPVDHAGPVYVNGAPYTGDHTIDASSDPVTVTFIDGLPYETDTNETTPIVVDYYAPIKNISNWTKGSQVDASLDEMGDPSSCVAAAMGVDISGSADGYTNTLAYTLESNLGVMLPDNAIISIGYVESTYTLYSFATGTAREGHCTSEVLLAGTYFTGVDQQTYTRRGYSKTVAHFNNTANNNLKFYAWGFDESTGAIVSEPLSTVNCMHFYIEYTLPVEGWPKKINTMDICLEISNSGGGGSYPDGSVNPADAIESVFAKIGVDAFIDAPSFLVAWNWFDTNTYRFNGFIDGGTRCRETIKDMCRQCRAYIVYNAGAIKLSVRQPLSSLTSVFTAGVHNTQLKSIRATRQRVSDVTNRITALYSKASWNGDYTEQYAIENAASISDFGLYDAMHLYSLISLQPMAEDVADFWLAYAAYPYTMLTVNLYFDAFPIEIGDAITVQSSFSKFYSFKGDIMNMNRISGSGKNKQITLFETTLKATSWDDTL